MPTLPVLRARRPGRARFAAAVAAALLLGSGPGDAASQDPNYTLPPADIERRLTAEPFQIAGMADNRWQGDRTQRTALRFRDGVTLPVKWARSEQGGFALNNQPRYELAAYRLQALFLDRDDWVVPPTALRVLPLRVYRQLDPQLEPTFEGTSSVLVVVQYWLEGVEPFLRPDSARLDDDTYAARLANLNLLTFLIRHADSNHGNVLISRTGEPRMFTVDNGVSFGSPDSPRGTLWKDLHVARVPRALVDRLRAIDRTALERALAVVAELHEGEDGRLELATPGPKRSPNRGVEFADGVVQMGLTDRELGDLWDRLRELLRRIDAGQITTF